MATTAVIDSLTQVVQDCLEAKLQAGFDANAALSLDIAREVAAAVQAKANEYTDVEIANVMSLISGGEVDLGPFTDFMNSVKTLIDGDESTEGYQIFEMLVSDTANNKQTLINHTTTLAAIQQNLTTMQATLANHETRIAALEAAQHEPIDCEDCHDELLNIIKNAIGDACTASQTAIDAYQATTSESVLAAWSQEIDPVSVTMVVAYDEVTDTFTVTGSYTGRKVGQIGIVVGTGIAPGTTGNAVLDTANKTFSWTFTGNSADALGQTVVATAKTTGGVDLGYSGSGSVEDPSPVGPYTPPVLDFIDVAGQWALTGVGTGYTVTDATIQLVSEDGVAVAGAPINAVTVATGGGDSTLDYATGLTVGDADLAQVYEVTLNLDGGNVETVQVTLTDTATGGTDGAVI